MSPFYVYEKGIINSLSALVVCTVVSSAFFSDEDGNYMYTNLVSQRAGGRPAELPYRRGPRGTTAVYLVGY